MAINYLNSIDLNQNELLQGVVENQPNDASAGSSGNRQTESSAGRSPCTADAAGNWGSSTASVCGAGLDWPPP